MSDNRFVTCIAIGDSAEFAARKCLDSLKGFYFDKTLLIQHFVDNDKTGRAAKTRLPQYFVPENDYILYLDADTTVHGSLEPLFQILKDGWDMVIAPSMNQGSMSMAHMKNHIEKHETKNLYGFNPLHLQCGVIGFRNTTKMQVFFNIWHEQWQQHRGQDQAAFLRTWHIMPIKLWIVGNAFNGGEVIQHHFGSIKNDNS